MTIWEVPGSGLYRVLEIKHGEIELLCAYTLDCPQDYEPDDVARMHAEIGRLRQLHERIAAAPDDPKERRPSETRRCPDRHDGDRGIVRARGS